MLSLFDDYAAIVKSGLFDSDYYIATNPDVADLDCDPLLHYLEQGALELRNPSGSFDARAYVLQHQELGEIPHNPLLHFIRSQEADPRTSEPKSPDAGGNSALDGIRVPYAGNDLILGLDTALVEASEENAGCRVAGAGWVVARTPISEIDVAIGATSAVAQYGLRRGDVAQTFPEFPRSEQSGFAFILDELPFDETQGLVDIIFNIKTADGLSHRKSVLTYLLPTKAPRGSRTASATQQAPLAATTLRLEVDMTSVDEAGILHVGGWAICLTSITSVQIFIDDVRLGAAVYGQPRPDVGLLYQDYPGSDRSGFGLIADIGSFGIGRKTLKVRATDAAGTFEETAIPIDLEMPAVRGAATIDDSINVYCDVTDITTDGELVVKGWAICPTETDFVNIELDGVLLGGAALGLERPDVGNLYPMIPHARRSGFSFRRSIGSISEGEHMIVLYVRGGNAEAEVPIPVITRSASQQTAPVGNRVQPAAKDRFRLNIDIPAVVAGAMSSPVRGNLAIAGWALARQGVASIDISLNGEPLATASTGIRRQDVYSQFGDWPDALTSGFSALLPHRALPVGAHRLSIALKDTAGNSTSTEFMIEVEQAPETAGPWSLRRKMPIAEKDLNYRILEGLNWRPMFRIALGVPLNDQEAIRLARQTINSLTAQAYTDWRVIVTPLGKDEDQDTRTLRSQLVDGFPAAAERIDFLKASATARRAFAGSRENDATYLMALRPGDELGCDALLELAIDTGFHRGSDFLYADDKRTAPSGQRAEAFFKPDWSPDLLLSSNYIGRAWCADLRLVARAKVTIGEIVKYQTYGTVLRLTAAAAAIRHVPSVLFQHVDGPCDPTADRLALKRALKRRGIEGAVCDGVAPGIFRLKRKVPTEGLVSIVIPTCAAQGLIKTCIESIRGLTRYRNFEIICIENIPEDQPEWKSWLRSNADVVLETREPFNWSRFNNLAAAEAKGEFLLFLNDDIEIIQADWLDSLVEHAQRPEVGVVGPQLLYPDRRVQHAGMFLAGNATARHAFRYLQEDDPGYFGLAKTQRNVIAVTGACLMTRRETFDATGRFDETHTIINNDLDYCLRIWRAGLHTVYTPHSTLIHHEQASRVQLPDVYDTGAFDSQWGGLFVAGDPFFHYRLSKERDDYSCEWEPVQSIVAGHPVFARETIRNILIVKLDHIGDCVIALPAISRLKRHFPDARLCVLSSKASRAVWEFEPAIDEIIEFDFFHARSGLGLIEQTDDDWRALEERLRPYGFDLAVDLRRHTDTRPVLKHTGARYLAGFDCRGAFGWLDLAIEWAADQALFSKRQHAADDLINLIDAISSACETDRRVIAKRPSLSPGALANVPRGKFLFRKPVVCIHPAAGTPMRQWPPDYFTALINQLAASGEVNVAIIGGPDEAELAETILAGVADRSAIWSLIGKTRLSDLPGILSSCALFIGNNSGPHHIAAGLGVPTIGIHSGVTDAREWGPLGANAIAMNRDMTCSPCYSSSMDQCNRRFACLNKLMPSDVLRTAARMLAAGANRPSN